MSTEKLNGWLGLLANLGVIVGLVVLIFEIQQGNRIAVGNAEATWSLQASEVNRSVVDNESAGRLAGKLSVRNPELTATEIAQAKFFARQFANLWGSALELYVRELISRSTYEIALRDISVTMDELPGLVPYFVYMSRVYEWRYSNYPEYFAIYCDEFSNRGHSEAVAELGCPSR
jgi:hypothetical protein